MKTIRFGDAQILVQDRFPNIYSSSILPHLEAIVTWQNLVAKNSTEQINYRALWLSLWNSTT